MKAVLENGERAAMSEMSDVRPKALVVVAHWDDEVIAAWAAMSHFDCTVICLTDKHSAEYAAIFRRAVESQGGEPQSWNCPIRKSSGGFTQLCTPENIRRLAGEMARKDYRFCFVHHFNRDVGGHPQHAMAAALAYEALRTSGLQGRISLFGFGTHRRKFASRVLEALWLGHSPLCLTISAESNERRLAFARMYKPNFEVLYPVIFETQEKHYPVRAGGSAYGWWLRFKFGAAIDTWQLFNGLRRRMKGQSRRP